MEKKEIKVLSYNIHSGKNIWMTSTINNIISFLKNEKPDIIGIQEINENNIRGYQVTKLQRDLNYQVRFSSHVAIGNGGYGIAIFSSYPIIEYCHILLPSTKEQRGLLDVIVLINNCKVHTINTHLSLNSLERAQQFLKIKDYLNLLTDPFILVGDFNATIEEIDSLLIDTARRTKKEHLPTMMLYKKRIDYIFVSKDFNVLNYNVLPVKMSDHYPVVTDLILNNCNM